LYGEGEQADMHYGSYLNLGGILSNSSAAINEMKAKKLWALTEKVVA
jgi:hypothetical protein